MITKIIEATNYGPGLGGMNHGKFMLCRLDDEWGVVSAIDGAGVVAGRGWISSHLWVLDLQTGEGACFKPGGSPEYDLDEKHKIWVCPLFAPFLAWLYKQDLSSLDRLPSLVTLTEEEAASALRGYRREGKEVAATSNFIHVSEERRYVLDYLGEYTTDGVLRLVRDGAPLPLRLDLANHSPTGFAVGYSGSGPAQTALAILADWFERQDESVVDKTLEALGIEKDPEGPPAFESISWREYLAIVLHQDFKRAVVAGFPTNERFVLSSDEVAKALDMIVRQSQKRESR